jgi:hypothetical protein
MLPDQIKIFREMVTLKDGVHVLLRSMVKEDRAHLDELYLTASDDDLRYLRDNVKDPAILQGWCDNLNYDNILPILALVKDRAVGSGTLLFHVPGRRLLGRGFDDHGTKAARRGILGARRQVHT